MTVRHFIGAYAGPFFRTVSTDSNLGKIERLSKVISGISH